jgi:hypothetical protein
MLIEGSWDIPFPSAAGPRQRDTLSLLCIRCRRHCGAERRRCDAMLCAPKLLRPQAFAPPGFGATDTRHLLLGSVERVPVDNVDAAGGRWTRPMIICDGPVCKLRRASHRKKVYGARRGSKVGWNHLLGSRPDPLQIDVEEVSCRHVLWIDAVC